MLSDAPSRSTNNRNDLTATDIRNTNVSPKCVAVSKTAVYGKYLGRVLIACACTHVRIGSTKTDPNHNPMPTVI